MRLISFLCIFVLLAVPALGVTNMAHEAPVRVEEIIDGDTLTLDTGVVVRLVGIQAPKLALGRRDFTTWPLAEDARKKLIELTHGRTVQIGFGGQREDRHRRTLAHLYRQTDALWIQGEMLRMGMARVYTFSDNRALTTEMLVLEREARTARRGIWAHEFYAVRSPEELHGQEETFQLVQGVVLSFAKISDYMFLNFGADYKTDFTVVIDRKNWPRFAEAAVESYTGKTIRVRGWMEKWNGPMLRVSHPEQIEVLE